MQLREATRQDVPSIVALLGQMSSETSGSFKATRYRTKRAKQPIELGWHAGSRHPDFADAYAGQLAAGGRSVNLDRA